MAESHKQKKRKDDFLMQGAILAIAGVITKIIGVVYRIPLTNILGDEGMGFYGYAFEVYALALLLSSLSLPTVVSKLVSARMAMRQRRNAFRVFVCSLVFSLVIGAVFALIIFFGADLISTHIMESPLSAYALKVLAPGLFIVSVLGVLRGYFQGLGTMVPTAVSQVIEQIVNAVISLAGASILFGIGIKAAEKQNNDLMGPAYGAAGGTLGTIAGALSALFFLLFAIFVYRGVIRRQLRTDRTRRQESYGRILKILLITLVPIIFSTAIYNINQLLDMTIFNKIMAAQGYSEEKYMALLGIYSGKYNTLLSVPLAMANGLAASIIPSLTGAVARNDRPQIHNKINQSVRFTMLIAIPCFVGFVVLASPIMVLLFGDSSRTPALLLAVGSITLVFYCLSTVTNSVLQGLDKISVPAKNAGISLVVHIISLLIMLIVFKWNIYALVGSNIVFALCMCILNIRAIHKANGHRQEMEKTFVKPLLAAVIMGVVTYAVHLVLDLLIGGRIPTILSILAAVAVYAVSILKLGALSPEDIRDLPQGRKILRICRKLHLLPHGGR
ncbi:polysaccharide biosynthesis protein [Eubacterium sp. am_0171]|uniref:Probable cell division protein ytgP n=1 Tax=Faecalicatena contorta TaxID=39482 RepID=A0A174IE82_9FIRM|nr:MULTISPECIES: polysaccharide biosynthesis protein [Clostridia]MBS6762565.1 polysaccharide biosynthesis protein [Clostridium sp.]MDU7707073.1 polysaccharide biosynthesis protein [Clostridium sp.]MSC82701.1 oligosaccharide flippase family protein [Eubacterium sp. BIOML-A1]MSD04958.1 oligosaccharide flippase family protein [Eubacterium sp. BIOML-A2]RYT25412.1 polysaccharide biosynthesis protein [Eubacterium sp. am_0171]